MPRRRKSSSGSLLKLITGEPMGRIPTPRGPVARRRRGTLRGAKGNLKFEVESHVAREIFAVAYLALSFLLLLSIYGKLGKVGLILHTLLKPIFGAGIHFLPILFFGLSLGLFFSKKRVFGLARLTGVAALLVSLLSIFHLSVPAEELLQTAQEGKYGGYIGFVTNFLFRQALQIGNLGSSIIFVATFIIGVLLTFEFSIVRFLKEAKPEIRLEKRQKRYAVTDEGIVALDADEEEEDATEMEQEINIIKPNTTVDDRGDELDFEEPEEGEREERELEEDQTDLRREKEEEEISSATQPKSSYASLTDWQFPPLDILESPTEATAVDDELLKKNAEAIRDKLAQFGIEVAMSDVHVGPTVIQYTLRPHEGVKLSRITALKNDLALALSARAIRIEAPIPGKPFVGIEVPNDQRSMVRLREILTSDEWKEPDSKLKLPLGRTVSGKPITADLIGLPHILIAGATGSGKSVGLNSFLLALLYQNSPKDLRFIMIDPKRVELSTYNAIPHLLTPVITDVEKAATALKWAVSEMSRRYQIFADSGHRNIADYNADPEIPDKLPKIIVVVDELADLMMAVGKEVEASICRIAQMARAVGMHLIIATQRPSVDVITGLIKANISARIAYAVTSGIDSRTILDGIGAEDLLGQGDMLYISGNMSKPIRVQGVYVSSKEIERVTNHVKLTVEPEYNEEITSEKVAKQHVVGVPGGVDPLYQRALQLIVESRKASASLLQRRLEVGYARAARILDELEQNGVIGPVRGAKPREIFIGASEEAKEDV